MIGSVYSGVWDERVGVVRGETKQILEKQTFEIFGKVSPPIKKIFLDSCLPCHQGAKSKGGLDLALLTDEKQFVERYDQIQLMIEMLIDQDMPPEEGKQKLGNAHRKILIVYLRDNLKKIDCQGKAIDPGTVKLHRLNREEYSNTIKTLCYIHFDAAADFPADDSGYGFDNIADVLTLPPPMLEKYLAAAERITRQAIRFSKTKKIKSVTYRFGKHKPINGVIFSGGHALMVANSQLNVSHDFPIKGEYIIKINAYGDQAGDESANMKIFFNKKIIKNQRVTAVRNRPEIYEFKVKIKKPHRGKIGIAFTNDAYKQSTKETPGYDRNLGIDSLTVEAPQKGILVKRPESQKKLIKRYPTKNVSVANAAKSVMKDFATRAYRRPVTNPELKRLVQLVEKTVAGGASYEQGIQLAMQVVLISPKFLYRIEKTPSKKIKQYAYPITDYELATRLSYFLWSSMPDKTLMNLAKRNRLHQPRVLVSQVERMLKSQKSSALVENFSGQWLGIRKLEEVTPDQKKFPMFTPALAKDMQQETLLFFQSMIKYNKPITELIDADYSYLNKNLARHYSLSDAAIKKMSETKFKKYRFENKNRGGILTQASILTMTSNPTRTSPVKRGQWILDRLLDMAPPPPPADVPPLAEVKDNQISGTLRQRLSAHSQDPRCISCHKMMDPIGFAFENFDAIGRWREKDGILKIDASGTMPSGEKFKGAKGIKRVILTHKKRLVKCFVQKLMTYALGRGVTYRDRCAIQKILKNTQDKNYRINDLINEVVLSDAFLKRRTPKNKRIINRVKTQK